MCIVIVRCGHVPTLVIPLCIRLRDQNISASSVTLLIFAVGWALYGRPQPEHELMMPLLSLSPLNVLTH